jgi:hypothetical protein
MAPELDKKSPVGIVANLPPSKKEKSKKASEVRTEKNNGIREEGNVLFKSGNYGGAVVKYTECLNSDPQDALSLTNRAECFLRTRQFPFALKDADAAIAFDPSKSKALYKRALALNGLARYADAVKTLKELVQKEPQDATANNALAECEMLSQQAFLGDYNMPALLFGRLAMSFRRCADYVGPVAIVTIPEKGRGVVVTKDVKAGELLCVSSPLATAPIQAGVELVLIKQLVNAAARDWRDAAVIQTLPAETDVTKSAEIPAPDLSLFRKHLTKNDDVGVTEPRDQETFARMCGAIVKTSAIRNAQSVGVYPLPSFFNHACAPNACKLLVGNVMFVRAARDLQKGTEVCLKYFDVTNPEPERAIHAKRFGIETCVCRRCLVERVGAGDAKTATDLAAKKATAARELAVKDPANKKPGMDRDGEKAASAAAAIGTCWGFPSISQILTHCLPIQDVNHFSFAITVMDALQVNSPATLIAAMRGKAKASHTEITQALAEWKRTKGKSEAPDSNVLVELANWFDTKCDQLGACWGFPKSRLPVCRLSRVNTRPHYERLTLSFIYRKV